MVYTLHIQHSTTKCFHLNICHQNTHTHTQIDLLNLLNKVKEFGNLVTKQNRREKKFQFDWKPRNVRRRNCFIYFHQKTMNAKQTMFQNEQFLPFHSS